MAASKKTTNSSKTAHVMNLLSKNREPAPPAEEGTELEKEQPASASPNLPPIMASLSPDAAVSAEIKSALETALESEAPPTAPDPSQEVTEETSTLETENQTILLEPEPVEEETSPIQAEEPAGQAPEREPSEEEVPPIAELQEEPAAPEGFFEEKAEAPSPEEPASTVSEPSPLQEASPNPVPQPEPAPELMCLNIVEALVDEKVDKYIKMFGLCDCPRCKMDVKALALTSLVPQYVVIPPQERSFRLAIYESRLSSTVTAQILNACKIVMDHPRHDRA